MVNWMSPIPITRGAKLADSILSVRMQHIVGGICHNKPMSTEISPLGAQLYVWSKLMWRMLICKRMLVRSHRFQFNLQKKRMETEHPQVPVLFVYQIRL